MRLLRTKRLPAIAAILALVAAATGCGSGGTAGGPQKATLVLDFTPNAVHSGIYAALHRGFYDSEGIDLTVRQPGSSTDAPKLLAAGRTDFAILDIHDLGIARERGLDIVGIMPIAQRPLAAVIARGDRHLNSPRDLEGHTVGVTGLPSDEAVVDSEVAADGGDPSLVHRVTIGFNAVSSLAAGKVDAATGFWNAEGVTLRSRGVPIRIFKVDRYGAPSYPELVLTASEKTVREDPELVDAMIKATRRGYRFAVANPTAALNALLASSPSLDRREQAAQLRVLLPALVPLPFNAKVLEAWAGWDEEHGLLERPLDVSKAFLIDGSASSGGAQPHS